jgi:prophage regulatory protein
VTSTTNVSAPAPAQSAPVLLAGIEEILGLLVEYSREWVRELTYRSDFPEPAAELAQGDIWLRDDIEAWINEHGDALADMLRQTR